MSTQTIGPIPVGYAPDPLTAALTINEGGTLSASTVTGGTWYGPYPAAVTVAGGVSQLTVTTSDPILAETAFVQPGSWPAPQTDPSTFRAIGSPLPGNLSGPPPSAPALDWDVVLGSPLVDIAESGNVLASESTQPVHLKWTVADNVLGSPVILTGNSAVTAIEMAIVHGPPIASDWLPATFITRAVGDISDGEYSVLEVGPDQALALTDTTWHVWGRLTTTGEVIALEAPGYLTVQR